MALAPKISNAAAIAMCNAHVDLADAGSGAAYLEIRTGSGPSDCDTASDGTLLATLTMSDPAFGNAADATPGATATANTITNDTSADATGTAGYARLFDSDDNCIWQGSVGTSSADVILNTVSITAGDVVSCSSFTITVPES